MIDTAKLREECAYLIDVGEGMDCYTVLSLIDALEKARGEIERRIHERNYAQRECEACAEAAKAAIAERDSARALLRELLPLMIDKGSDLRARIAAELGGGR